MQRIIGTTESLCPECLALLPANRIEEDGNVYLQKSCLEHGDYQVIIWRGDAESYESWGKSARDGCPPDRALTSRDKGCPYDCGLCSDHKVNSCTMVMEITSRCDLKCPVCFAGSSDDTSYEPDISTIKAMYQTVLDTVGNCPIQLSGGEPTMRDDLPQIISLGHQMGFDHIMVNTNGLRLARDVTYLQRLKDSGLSTVYLQFDGLTNDVYRVTRGANIAQLKNVVIDNCARVKLGVVLVPVIIPGVNDHQIGDIFYFAKSHVPFVKGIHFQPISYFGRYPEPPSNASRITIPDILHALVQQTDGELKQENFIPRGVIDAHCSFSGLFVLAENGNLIPFNNINGNSMTEPKTEEQSGEELSRQFMSSHWRYYDRMPQQTGTCCGSSISNKDQSQNISGFCDSPGAANRNSCCEEYVFERALTHSLTISCMPFQDVWNIDLARLKGCCIHVATADKHIMPFCAYYVTSAAGIRLYGRTNDATMLFGRVASQQS